MQSSGCGVKSIHLIRTGNFPLAAYTEESFYFYSAVEEKRGRVPHTPKYRVTGRPLIVGPGWNSKKGVLWIQMSHCLSWMSIAM